MVSILVEAFTKVLNKVKIKDIVIGCVGIAGCVCIVFYALKYRESQTGLQVVVTKGEMHEVLRALEAAVNDNRVAFDKVGDAEAVYRAVINSPILHAESRKRFLRKSTLCDPMGNEYNYMATNRGQFYDVMLWSNGLNGRNDMRENGDIVVVGNIWRKEEE